MLALALPAGIPRGIVETAGRWVGEQFVGDRYQLKLFRRGEDVAAALADFVRVVQQRGAQIGGLDVFWGTFVVEFEEGVEVGVGRGVVLHVVGRHLWTRGFRDGRTGNCFGNS